MHLKAFLAGRRIVMLPVLLIGLALLLVSSINNAFNYTEVEANVERVEEVCRPVGEKIETASSARCLEASAVANRKWWRQRAVAVSYRSPADGEQHTGVIIPSGGQSAVDADKLRAGDRWRILAHDKYPRDIKAK